MHADAIQQLKVALLGSPAAEIMDILSTSLPTPATVTSTQLDPHTFTATPSAPPPVSVLLEGVSELSASPVMVTAGSFKPDKEIPVTSETTTLVSLSTSAQPSTSSIQPLSTDPATFRATVVMSRLAILADAYLKCLNRPGGGNDYLCQVCHVSQTNLDSILMHVSRHLDIIVGHLSVAGDIIKCVFTPDTWHRC